VPNRRVACRVGNLRREPGPVALTVSPPSNLRASHRAATVRPQVVLLAFLVVRGVARGMKDTSPQGRWHNGRSRAIGDEIHDEIPEVPAPGSRSRRAGLRSHSIKRRPARQPMVRGCGLPASRSMRLPSAIRWRRAETSAKYRMPRAASLGHSWDIGHPTSIRHRPQSPRKLAPAWGFGGGRGRYRTADRWCVKPELYH
jgi:hypothetical protein